MPCIGSSLNGDTQPKSGLLTMLTASAGSIATASALSVREDGIAFVAKDEDEVVCFEYVICKIEDRTMWGRIPYVEGFQAPVIVAIL